MRIQTHHWVVLSAWVSKVITALIQIIVIRVLIERIGVDLYAAMAVLTGLAGWYALADFGIGSSLQNHIAERQAANESADGYICTALIMALLVLLLLMGLQQFASFWLGPILLKNIHGLDDAAKVTSFLVFGQLSLVGAVTGIVYKIWYATRKGYLANILPALAAVFGLVAVEFVPETTKDNQLLWSIVSIVAPSVFLLLPLALGYGIKTLLHGGRLTSAYAHALTGRAFQFMGLAVMAAVVLQFDYIVISQFLDATDIVVYNVLMRLFNTAFFVYYSVLLASWPILTGMIARGEWGEVRAKVKGDLIWGVVFMLAVTFGVLVFEQQLFEFLAPNISLTAGSATIALLGFYFCIRIWTDTFSTILASISRIGPLLKWVPVQAAISVALQVYLAPRYGVVGIVVALIAAFLLTVAWVLPRRVFMMWSSR